MCSTAKFAFLPIQCVLIVVPVLLIGSVNVCHAQYGFYNQQFAPGFGPLQSSPQINVRPDILRDMDGRPLYDPLQPDPARPKPAFFPRMYEHSDQRCKDLLTRENYEEFVQVSLRFGKVIGRVAYLCDHPDVRFHERPMFGEQMSRYHFDSMTNRFSGSLPRIRGNVSVFLGVPYARPPIRDSGLRFKVRSSSALISFRKTILLLLTTFNFHLTAASTTASTWHHRC